MTSHPPPIGSLVFFQTTFALFGIGLIVDLRLEIRYTITGFMEYSEPALCNAVYVMFSLDRVHVYWADDSAISQFVPPAAE